MTAIRLRVPKQNPEYIGSVPDTVKALDKWRAELPLANQRESVATLNTLLGRMNRIPLKPELRYELLMRLHPVVGELTNVSKKSYLSSRLPLPNKTAESAAAQRQLLTAMADGFKIIAIEKLRDDEITTANDPLIAHALYRAIAYLTLIALEHYLIYAEQPMVVWGELNQLYALAESRDLDKKPIDGSADSEPATIAESYQRILLLALSNPYHLMQGEAARLFACLKDWAQYCRLIGGLHQPGKSGKFVVDLAAAAPPRYSSAASDPHTPRVARVIDVAPLLTHLDEIMQRSAQQTTIAERTQHAMFRRVARAWGARSERLSPRKERDMTIEIVFGLRHCHQLMSNNAEFQPEETEAALLRGDTPEERSNNLVLLSTDTQRWQEERARERVVSGITQPRTSKFNGEVDDYRDIWKKVYTTRAQAELYLDELHPQTSATEYTIALAKQGTESQGGLDLSCAPDQSNNVRVGDLVGFRNEGTGADDPWEIGSITWMRVINDGTVYIGIKRIASDALAVASRGLLGVGEGSEYFRSLIVPALDPAEHPTSIVTPAGVYDVDSRIFINTGDKVLHVRLTQMIDTTNAYSQFRFQRLHQSS